MLKKYAALLCTLLSLSAFGIGIVRTVPKIKENRYYQELWKAACTHAQQTGNITEYQEKIPLEEMNLQPLLDAAEVGVMYEEGSSYDFSLKLNEDIHYFSIINGKKQLVLTLTKGTEVKVNNTGVYPVRIPGYGIYTLPTYDRNWRYCRAFYVKDDINDGYITSDASEIYYYVKTEEIEKAAGNFIEKFAGQPPVSEEMTEEAYKNQIFSQQVYGIDNIYVGDGIYLSPNLLVPIMDTVNILLSVFAVIMLLLSVILFLKSKKHGIGELSITRDADLRS